MHHDSLITKGLCKASTSTPQLHLRNVSYS